MILMTQLNPILASPLQSRAGTHGGVVIAFVSALTLLATAPLLGFGGLLGIMIPLWFVVSSAGLSFLNAPAIALSRHGEEAGTAAALLGATHNSSSAAPSPLGGGAATTAA